VDVSIDLDAWRAILEGIRRERSPLAAVLEHAAPLAFGPEQVVLGYEPESFLAAQATDTASIDLLTRIVRGHYGRPTAIAFDLSPKSKGMATVATIDSAQRQARLAEARQAVAEHPLVRAAIDILGAELREVRLSGE
jgi:DNA polymerase-3 subunit gamma/tau